MDTGTVFIPAKNPVYLKFAGKRDELPDSGKLQ